MNKINYLHVDDVLPNKNRCFFLFVGYLGDMYRHKAWVYPTIHDTNQ